MSADKTEPWLPDPRVFEDGERASFSGRHEFWNRDDVLLAIRENQPASHADLKTVRIWVDDIERMVNQVSMAEKISEIDGYLEEIADRCHFIQNLIFKKWPPQPQLWRDAIRAWADKMRGGFRVPPPLIAKTAKPVQWCNTCQTALMDHSKLDCKGCEQHGAMVHWRPRYDLAQKLAAQTKDAT